jgi:hypothetical protein
MSLYPKALQEKFKDLKLQVNTAGLKLELSLILKI